MTKFHKLWKALRMCSTQASTTPNAPKVNRTEVFGIVLDTNGKVVSLLVSMGAAYGLFTQTKWHLNWTLKNIVTAKYDPEMPKGITYIKREQDDELKVKLRKHICDGNGFFMVTGESGSGITTMMQNLLKTDYEDGVIFVKINAAHLMDVPKNQLPGVFEAAVMNEFDECKNHPRRRLSFDNFIGHANDVRLKNQKKWRTWLMPMWFKIKEHPLIIYITLDTKDKALKHETMQAIAVAVGGMASNLSSKANKCETILEFSKTGISDHVLELRGDYDDFAVKAMTETEFQEIGKQVLNVEDPQNLVPLYLEHYHNWLGGHTKGLMQLKKSARPGSMHRFVAFLYYMIFNHTSHRS